MNKKLIFPILIIFIIYISCSNKQDKIIGVKIYESNSNYKELVSEWKTIGINTAFISKELAANKVFRNELKKQDINTFIICPVFQNPEVLKTDSSLYAITNKGNVAKDDWVEFVCPSRKVYRNKQVNNILSYIKDYQPDGISIDFIRHFVFWEMIYADKSPESFENTCYCDSCTKEFALQESISIPDTCISIVQKAQFLAQNHLASWNNFRCELIVSMVKEISEKAKKINPAIKINVHVVPWRDEDFEGANINVAGQDIKEIAQYADYISPMCYSQMLKRDDKWISSVVSNMDSKAPNKILPSIQVFPYYVEEKFTPEDFRKCIHEALTNPSQGVVFWSWPLFEKDQVRKEMAKEVVKK